jgi:membrane protease YdiL (CAAX protease family)
MNSVGALWLRIAGSSGAACVLLVVLSPPCPAERCPLVMQPAAGAATGGLLFLILARSRPRFGSSTMPVAALAARWGILGLLATGEEIVWRRVALGELLFGGPAAALAATTLGFALAHRSRPALHLLTGGTFGGLYLATGGLAASIVAHWVYNVLVSTLDVRRHDPQGVLS